MIDDCRLRTRTPCSQSTIINHQSEIPQSRWLESNQLLRVFSTALLPSQLRREVVDRRPVPRQGIEPCVCRLKAGGFAFEACEAPARVARPVSQSRSGSSQFRELESNQRPPPSKSGFSTSTESPGMNLPQLPRQESNLRRPPSESGFSTSTESPAMRSAQQEQRWQESYLQITL